MLARRDHPQMKIESESPIRAYQRMVRGLVVLLLLELVLHTGSGGIA